MNWQDLLNSLNASDDPQADAAGQGWKQIGNSAPVQQALDFSGNLKRADDDLGASAQSMKDMIHSGVASNPEADERVAQRSLATAMGTIKAAELTPNEKIRQLSQEYMKAKNLKSLPDQPYAKVDQGVAKKIAQAYEDMKHDPENPEVKAAYKALIDETNAQFQKLKESGLKIDKITGENPYKSSADMMNDIRDNNHISYYPTDSGFGTETSTSNHPLLAKSGQQINGEDVPANDIFRIVHDYFGHAKEGPGFGPRGEENAFREHSQMYSPEALKALTTETRGQNSWVNYGPKGEANRANPANTTFAEQKAGLLPDWTSKFNKTLDTLKPEELSMDEASRLARAKEMGFDTNNTMYHGTRRDFDTFKEGDNSLGIHFGSPKQANDFKALTGRDIVQDEKVLPVYLKSQNPLKIDFDPKQWEAQEFIDTLLKNQGSSLPKDQVKKLKELQSSLYDFKPALNQAERQGRQAYEEVQQQMRSKLKNTLKDLGYDSVHYPNIYEGRGPNGGVTGEENATSVFEPNQIRSKFAKFNPDDSDSGNIAAALGALGIGGAASQMSDEDSDKFSSLKKKLGL